MTQPGTTAHEIPRDADWIARSIADIYRKLRRLGAAGGSAIDAMVVYQGAAFASWPNYGGLDVVDNVGDNTAYWDVDGLGDVVHYLAEGWYQASGDAIISGLSAGQLVSLAMTTPGDLATSANGASISGTVTLTVTSPVFYVPSGSTGMSAAGSDVSLAASGSTGGLTVVAMRLCLVKFSGIVT